MVDPIDLQQDYFDLKMDDVEQPSTFIVKLERQRKKLKDNGIKYGDDEFLKQILAKLPKGKDGELGPYQVEKRNIELQMQTKQGYGIGDLTTALEKVYKDIYGEDGSGKANEQAYLAYKKVYKGRCDKCGKYGHKARDCRGSDYQPNNGFKGKCYFCEKVGHRMQDCREMKRCKDALNEDRGNFTMDEVAF